MEKYSDKTIKKLDKVARRMKELGLDSPIIIGYNQGKFLKAFEDDFKKTFSMGYPYSIEGLYFTISEDFGYYRQDAHLSVEFINNNTWETTSFRNYSSCASKKNFIMDECGMIKTIEIMEKICAMREKEIADAQSNMPIDEIYPLMRDYANKYLSHTEYTATYEYGKRNMDKEMYNCLVIRYGERKSYRGSIVLYQNNFKECFITYRVPLCGGSSMKLSQSDWKKQLEKIIDFIIN